MQLKWNYSYIAQIRLQSFSRIEPILSFNARQLTLTLREIEREKEIPNETERATQLKMSWFYATESVRQPFNRLRASLCETKTESNEKKKWSKCNVTAFVAYTQLCSLIAALIL